LRVSLANFCEVNNEIHPEIEKEIGGSLETYLKAKYNTLADGRIVIAVLPTNNSITNAKIEDEENNDEYGSGGDDDLPF